MIKNLFEITKFLDDARWEVKTNYNLINFYNESLPDDDKLLTHWLCYMTDRRMPFKKVWDVGGFVFSELVHDLKGKKNFNLLNPNKPEISFFIKQESYKGKNREEKSDYLFVSHQIVKDNEKLSDYGFKNDRPYFISRYYPSDYKSILSTFHILKMYDYNLTKFIISVIENIISDDKLIPKLLFAMYLLSYYEIGQPKAKDINFQNFNKESEKRAKYVKKIFLDSTRFNSEYKKFSKATIFKQKRAWCSLRDFFKSPEFKEYFFRSLRHEGFKNIERLNYKSLLTQFELPGDVWNNNDKFRECILRDTKYKASRVSFGKLLRKIYSEEKITSGYYPEQFDITFDFVPRMCVLDNCSICPYGILNGKAIDFEIVCTKNINRYCPVVLVSCNYKMDCKGGNCKLLELYRQNFVRQKGFKR